MSHETGISALLQAGIAYCKSRSTASRPTASRGRTSAIFDRSIAAEPIVVSNIRRGKKGVDVGVAG